MNPTTRWGRAGSSDFVRRFALKEMGSIAKVGVFAASSLKRLQTWGSGTATSAAGDHSGCGTRRQMRRVAAS